MILWGKRAKDVLDRLSKLEALETGERLGAIERELVRQMTTEKQAETPQSAIISMPDEEGKPWPIKKIPAGRRR